MLLFKVGENIEEVVKCNNRCWHKNLVYEAIILTTIWMSSSSLDVCFIQKFESILQYFKLLDCKDF